MSYNYPGAPGQYGQAGYGAAPGVAPGMAPPGMNGNSNYDQGQQANNRQGGFPPNMKPPQNMPNINFNAPVIRLGTSGPVNNAPQSGRGRDSNTEPSVHRGRAGLGLDNNRGGGDRQPRESFNLMPPTREEIFRTIFVGNIPDGVGGDVGMERLLRCAGHLRRWTRATDADNKLCKFGFAEFEDAESLETAAEVFQDIQVPLKKIAPGTTTEDEAEVEKATLLFVVDAASQKYADEWREKRNEDETTVQFRLDTARDSLREVLASLFNPSSATQDADGDTAMNDVEQDPLTGEYIPINTAEPEDELSDIPAEHRETVAKEIAAFRDRSIRRDLEKQRKEEEEEERARQDRNRMDQGVPSGPGRGANGVPMGPSGDRSVPTGPKGPRGYQMPKDYQNDRDFVRASDSIKYNYISKKEEDSDASDDELEARRQSKKDAINDKEYEDEVRRWQSRERSRISSIERTQRLVEEDEKALAKNKEAMAAKYKEWNTEEQSKREQFFTDHSEWLRRRQAQLDHEQRKDDQDRRNEEDEIEAKREKDARANGAADAFLDRQAKEMEKEAVPRQSVKINFGAAAAAQQKPATAGASKRRTAFEVEGLLDQEDSSAATKLTLKPINPKTLAEAAALTPEERQEAARQLAADIPSDKDGLWKWDIHWDSVTDEVIDEQLKPFVEKKIVEYLGVQEDMLVEVVEQHIRARKGPDGLVEELEPLLDEEAESLVRKLWRMVIFFSESERRGLGA